MKGNIVQLSMEVFGCRVVQKLLETFFEDEDKVIEILGEIEEQIQTILNNKNGNHVIQKCFDVIHHEKLQFIIDNAIQYARYFQSGFLVYICQVVGL